MVFKEQNSKCPDGGSATLTRETIPKIREISNKARCPVEIFELFELKRPVNACIIDAIPLYSTVKPEKILKNQYDWYFPSPMGINTISEMMKVTCKNAGITKREDQSFHS